MVHHDTACHGHVQGMLCAFLRNLNSLLAIWQHGLINAIDLVAENVRRPFRRFEVVEFGAVFNLLDCKYPVIQ